MELGQLRLTFIVHCRLLHLTLLVFNYIAVWSLSVISGGKKSAFSRQENASALILVASQVKTQSVAYYSKIIYEMSIINL